MSLAKVGTDKFKATIAEGAPFEIVVPSSQHREGTIAGNATTITIPTGAVESAPLEVTRGADPYVAVTVDIGSPLPVPPNSQASNVLDNDHTGYALAKAAGLPLEIFPETPSTAIDLSIEPAEVAEDAGATTLTVTAELDANALADDLVVTLTRGAPTTPRRSPPTTPPGPSRRSPSPGESEAAPLPSPSRPKTTATRRAPRPSRSPARSTSRRSPSTRPSSPSSTTTRRRRRSPSRSPPTPTTRVPTTTPTPSATRSR